MVAPISHMYAEEAELRMRVNRCMNEALQCRTMDEVELRLVDALTIITLWRSVKGLTANQNQLREIAHILSAQETDIEHIINV